MEGARHQLVELEELQNVMVSPGLTPTPEGVSENPAHAEDPPVAETHTEVVPPQMDDDEVLEETGEEENFEDEEDLGTLEELDDDGTELLARLEVELRGDDELCDDDDDTRTELDELEYTTTSNTHNVVVRPGPWMNDVHWTVTVPDPTLTM
jgi:hypothetical protein